MSKARVAAGVMMASLWFAACGTSGVSVGPTGATTSTAPSAEPTTTPTTTAEPTAEPTTAVTSPIVGEWVSEFRCEHIVEVLTAGGYGGTVISTIVGNGLIPGVTSDDQIGDPADPCAGAVVLAHSHAFTADGQFFSYDDGHAQVDAGRYEIVDADTLAINSTPFTYVVDADTLTLVPDLPANCASTPCAGAGQWATMVAQPGLTWERVPD